MRHLCVELFVLGSFNDDNHQRQLASLGTFDEDDLEDLACSVKRLVNCGLDLLIESEEYQTEE